MLSVRKQDPLFINFVPKNAEEAVDRYVRCKRRGLKPYLIPECLISCAQGLSPEELEKFERWIVNPEGNTDDKMELVETKQLQAENAAVFEENAKRVESLLLRGEELRSYPLVTDADSKAVALLVKHADAAQKTNRKEEAAPPGPAVRTLEA